MESKKVYYQNWTLATRLSYIMELLLNGYRCKITAPPHVRIPHDDDVRADVAPACHTRTHPSNRPPIGRLDEQTTDATRRARDVETHGVRAHEI